MKYPQAIAASPEAAADEIAEVFEMLGDRDEKNRYVLDDLGAHLPHYFDLLKKVTDARAGLRERGISRRPKVAE